MKITTLTNRNLAAGLACLAALLWPGSAPAQLTVTSTTAQGSSGVYPYTPPWTPAADSLIAGVAPTVAVGDFGVELTNRNVLSLTAGGSLSISIVTGNADDSIGHNTTCTNYVTGGNYNNSGADPGSLLVYTLPASTYGYNLTNITVDGGWADNGRDGQSFTVLYSTMASPGHFIFLTNVDYIPGGLPGGTAIANQDVIHDAAGGVIASNVNAVEFILNAPNSENGFVGYGAITVEGKLATTTASPVVAVTTATETGPSPFMPDWTLETPSLIAGMAPSTAVGNFTQESSGGTPVLTDGVIGDSGDVTTFATCGANGGTSLVYTLTNSVYGSDVTNIVTYSGWGNEGRDGQYYIVSYSTVSAPTKYIPITTVCFNPSTNNAVANRVAIAMSDGSALAKGVANIKFDFGSPSQAGNFNNAYQGYSEIIVQGKNSATPPPPPSPYLTQDTLPTAAQAVAGDQVILTAAFSNGPPANLQWLFISGSATNVIAGATSTNLVLNNVGTTNTGYYTLEAVNATNGAAAPSFSTPALLAVSNTPAPVNGITVDYASQCGLGINSSDTNFIPTWPIDLQNDLILGFQAGSGPGTFTYGQGVFGESQANYDPTILSDGSFGYWNYWPNVGGSQTLCTCGVSPAGESMTYTLVLTSAPYGLDITNITVYGGWGDGGRDEQKYQVLYSTVAAPTVFNALITADFNPNDPTGGQCATRTKLVSTSGPLARNVAAIEFNFDLQGAPPKNGYEGYSEFVVQGVASGNVPTLTNDITPLTAEDVQGSSLTLTAGFSGATGYQWQKNGTNIPNATGQTLTLHNLQLSDTATNGGYRLVAMNGAGSSVTRGCSLIVDPTPAPVSNIITAFAYQTSDQASFAPTWDTSSLSSSLIYQQYPPAGGYDPVGNFNDPDVNSDSHGLAGGLPVLTDGNYGYFVNTGPHPAFATCGPTAGQYVIYTLGSAADGYTVTNIQIAGGWNDGGRDTQQYTVSYSTVANPITFIPIVAISNNPPVTDESVIRATYTAANGVIASNVSAIMVDFTQPPNVPNGYSGYSEISVFGAPSTVDKLPILVSGQNESPAAGTSPDWVIETDSLIEGMVPSIVGPGSFAGNFNNEPQAGGLPVLTDGTFGPVDAETTYATCGGAYGAGEYLAYTAPTGIAWNLTNIVVYSGWGNYNRDGQFYNVSYSTASAPDTYIPLVSVGYNPTAMSSPSANRVDIAPATGTYLATNVYAVKFDFTPQTGNLDNGYSGYAEIVLQGASVAVPVLPQGIKVAALGGKLTFIGTNGTPNGPYTVLTSTNLLTPLADWTVSATGSLDGTGALSNSIPINPAQPAGFFRLRMP